MGLGRRLIAILLGLILLAAAASLAAPPVAIRVWLPGFSAYRELMAADFAREYPEVKLNLVCEDPADYQVKLLTAVAARNAPDLSLVDYSSLGVLADAQLLEPLAPYLEGMRDLGAFNPLLLQQLVLKDQLIGLPATAHPLALFIRQDWLAKFGLKPPSTWDEIYQIAESFTKRDPDGNGKVDTYGLAEYWPETDPAVATRFVPWLYQSGGLVASSQDGRWVPGFGSPAGAKALRLRRRLWEYGDIPPSAPTNDAAQNLALFTSGQAGMIVEDDRAVPAIRQALSGKVISVMLPRDIRRCTIGDGLCFVLFSNGNNKTAAFTFVQWWLAKETQQKLILGWDGKIGGAGTNQGPLVLGPRADLDPAVLLAEPLYDGFVKSFPFLSPEPYCPNYGALKLIMAKAIAAAMGPKQTVEEALAAGMKEAREMLGR